MYGWCKEGEPYVIFNIRRTKREEGQQSIDVPKSCRAINGVYTSSSQNYEVTSVLVHSVDSAYCGKSLLLSQAHKVGLRGTRAK